MLEVHAEVMRRLDAQMRAAHGLSVSAYEVLMFLGDAPDRRMRMSDLAQRVLLSRVARGDVTRCADSDDGRGLHAEITDAGLITLRAARATHHAGVREFFLHRLGDADQITLGEIWGRLRGTPSGPLGDNGASKRR
jgi:DNA-binding MarR family transcriptional regulator